MIITTLFLIVIIFQGSEGVNLHHMHFVSQRLCRASLHSLRTTAVDLAYIIRTRVMHTRFILIVILLKTVDGHEICCTNVVIGFCFDTEPQIK